MRFWRVQLQLKATNENTQIIISELKRSYFLEKLFMIDLILTYILANVAYEKYEWFGSQNQAANDKFDIFLKIVYVLTEFIFITMFCSLMAGVNR